MCFTHNIALLILHIISLSFIDTRFLSLYEDLNHICQNAEKCVTNARDCKDSDTEMFLRGLFSLDMNLLNRLRVLPSQQPPLGTVGLGSGSARSSMSA